MSELNIKTLNELLNNTYEPQQWLVDKIIPEDGVVLMSAAPASFKTWLMLEMCKCVSSGISLFNRFSTKRTGTLLIDEESGERTLHDRFNKLNISKDLPIHYLSRSGLKLSESNIKEILDFCKENDVRIIIWDSLTRFHTANENDSGEMSRVMEHFKRLTDNGITCLVAHHSRKSNQFDTPASSMRGSSDILAACDVHIAISRQGNNITVVQTKNRFNEELCPFKARFTKVDDTQSEWQFVGYEETNEDKRDGLKNNIVQCITDNEGFNQKQILDKLQSDGIDIREKKLRELLRELLLDGYIEQLPGDRTEKLYFVNGDFGRTAE